MANKNAEASDSELWERFLSDDDEAFKNIYKNNVDDLFNYGKRFSNNDELIKDCIQDLFVDLHHYRQKLSKIDKIKPYLLISLKRIIVKRLKTESGRKFFDINQLSFELALSDNIVNEHFEDKLDTLKIAIKELSPRQREAIYLKYVSGLSYEELTKVLKLNYQTSRNLIYRGMQKLRKSLGAL